MSDGQSGFGVSNLEYDLVTTLSNLLQAEEVLQKYIKDAEQAGDNACAELFRTMQQNNRTSAMRFRTELQRHLSK